MPSIQITDSLETEVVTANPIINSGFGKYLKGIPAQLLAGADFISQFRQPLQLLQPGTSGFGLTFRNQIPLGENGVALSVAAGSQAFFTVHNRSGKELFESTFIGEPLKVPGGKAYVSFILHPSVDLGIATAAGAMSFGFEAGTGIELRSFQPFDLLGATNTFGEAARATLENFVIPNDLDDLERMPAGSVSSVSGHGQFRIGLSVDLAASFNPLASLNTMTRIGRIDANSGATLSAGVRATLTGDYQIRVHKSGENTVRLSYHKMAGAEFAFTVDARLSSGLTVGKRDLLKNFLQMGSRAPSADIEQLVDARLSDEQIDQFNAAIQAGMRRRLQLSLNGEFSTLKQDEAAFLYEIDLARLDAAGKDAVAKALQGDLSALNLLEPESDVHGFTVIQTRTGNLRRKRISWRINLLGIVNVLSLSELVREGTVIHDPESGDLVITDEVTSSRIGAVSDSKNIRKAVFECAMLSATYKAAGVDVNSGLKASQTFFALDPNANRQKMKDYLDAVVGLGLMTAAGRDSSLEGIGQFGSSTILLETEFDQQACEALFLDETGAARPAAYYERVGRNAILSLIQPGDPDDYRRIPANNETLWQRMKSAGQFNFKAVLPAPITGGSQQDVRVGVVIADFTLIVWWAGAMATAASCLLDVRRALGGTSAESLQADENFRTARTTLEHAMAGAIRRNKSSFGDPWGLLAMFNAAKGAASARATVTSPRLTVSLPQ